MMMRKNLSSVGRGNFRGAIQSRWSSMWTSFLRTATRSVCLKPLCIIILPIGQS